MPPMPLAINGQSILLPSIELKSTCSSIFAPQEEYAALPHDNHIRLAKRKP